MLGLVAADLGVSLLPSSVLNIERRGVTTRRLTAQPPSLQLAIVRRKADQSRAVHNFVSLARELPT